MKSKLLAILSVLILFSCEDNSFEATLPAYKEVYYRIDTGEKQAEKVFIHDSRGNLINERYYDLKFSQSGYEIQYTYDALNRRTKLVYIFSDQNSSNKVLYSYQNNMLMEERTFSGNYESQKFEYFYSNRIHPDSIRIYSHGKNGYTYDHSKLFTYDNQDRLIEERWSGGLIGNTIIKMNVYSNNRLMETCNPLAHMPEGKNCIKNEYDMLGNLSRVYSTLTGEPDVLLEEYDYDGTILTSKRIFNQQDGFPVYNADQTRYTILVKYEYP